MMRTIITNYVLKEGLVKLEAGANLQRQKDVLEEAYSVLKGEHSNRLLQYLEGEVNAQLGVPSETFKLLPQIKLDIYNVELEMCGRTICLSYGDSLEDVFARWDKLMSR